MTESRVYEMENTFSPSLHMDLKRDLSMGKRASGDNITLVDGPLFERYQFFTPGSSQDNNPSIANHDHDANDMQVYLWAS